MSHRLLDVYQRLFDAFGPQFWWPGESKLEVIIGAVLTQNTLWTNVQLAIENLREADVLSFHALLELPPEELSELIRPAGYYRLKAKRLRNLLTWIESEFGGSLDTMFQAEMSTLRNGLLTVNGIGPETADSILLYAGEMPSFVVDAYTARFVKRHEWIDEDADYYQLKDLFESQLPADTSLFNEFHALIVRLGKTYCKPKPNCGECPLWDLLPEGSPLRCAGDRST